MAKPRRRKARVSARQTRRRPVQAAGKPRDLVDDLVEDWSEEREPADRWLSERAADDMQRDRNDA